MQRPAMVKAVLACVLLFVSVIPSAQAATQVHPEVVSFSGNITCPDLYPIKTGSSSGGNYTTTCYSELAWSLNMLGGDDWQSWINGTYVPTPTPTPTVTVTPAPVIQTRTVTQTVLEPCPVIAPPSTRQDLKNTIKAKLKEVKQLRKQLKDTQKSKR